MILLLSAATFAQVNATVSAGASQTLTNAGNAGTVAAWGGNVTRVNVTINASTRHWQGFYGSVNGSLALGAGTNVLKTWSLSTITGQVYVSQNNNVDFSTLNGTVVTLSNMDSAFSFLTGANDAAANTGTNSANSAFNIGSYSVLASSKPKILTQSNTGAQVWETVVLTSNTSDATKYVFAGILNNSGTAFDGTSANFQVIVPENSAGNTAVTNYYFYGEVQ